MGGGEEGDTAIEGVTTGVLGALPVLQQEQGLGHSGIGPLVAMGPDSRALSGAVTGGLAGGLIDWEFEEEGKHIEEDIKQGKILLTVQGSEPA